MFGGRAHGIEVFCRAASDPHLHNEACSFDSIRVNTVR